MKKLKIALIVLGLLFVVASVGAAASNLHMVGIILRNEAGVEYCVYNEGVDPGDCFGATNTPTLEPARTGTATALPTATETPTGVPTATTTPTATITPSNTPVPTAAASNTPVPTATDFWPSPTVETVCLGVWPENGGLIVRSESYRDPANPSENMIGLLQGPTEIQIWEIRIWREGVEEWGEIIYQGVEAWVAIYFDGVAYIELNNSPECIAKRFDYDDITRTNNGAHSVLTQVDQNDMVAGLYTLAANGYGIAAKTVETWQPASWALTIAQDAGVLVSSAQRYKLGAHGDCADTSLDPVAAAQQQWDRHSPTLLTYAPPAAGYMAEVDNECDYVYWPKGAAWLDAYLTAEIEIFSQAYPGRVIFGTMYAGGWTEERIRSLSTTWEAALEHDACMGMHQGTLPADQTGGVYYSVDDARSMEWLFRIVFQQRTARRVLIDMDPRYADIEFCITEAAIAGAWAPFDTDEYAEYACRIYAFDNVRMMTAYTIGVWNRPEFSINGKFNTTAIKLVACLNRLGR
jgi:hypothetical protein